MVRVHVWKVEWCPTYAKHVVVLKELEGQRLIPIIVEEWEAQTIEVLLNQKSQQPYKTARLFSYLIENLNAKIVRVEIHKRFHGEILAKVIYCNQDETFTISHSPGEAIELAMRCRAPLMIPEALLFAFESKNQQSEQRTEHLKQLKEKLEKAIAVENYEEAAKLRDEILELEKRMKIK
jgi:bifunctional DNase/RNase